MRLARLASVIIVSASLAGCDNAMDNIRDQLADRQRSWQRLGINDYSFVLQEICFCSPDSTEPWRITVRQNQVVSVVSVTDGHAASPSLNLNVRTIDWLFGRIRDHTNGKGAIVEVDFDPEFSFPTRARLDTQNVLDGASTFTVAEFRRE